ncbi:MAG: hypothetical protein RRY40_04875, partial [Oscillospiraceae bacterium]
MATCGIAIYLSDGFSGDIFKPKAPDDKISVSEGSSQESSAGENSEGEVSQPMEEELVKIPLPSEVKAGTLKAGREIPLNDNDIETKEGIDKYLNFALSSGLNTVVIDTATDQGRLIYKTLQGDFYSFGESFSPISYAVDKAHELGLYTMVIFYATPNNFGENPIPLTAFDNTVYGNILSDITNFTKTYRCDTL